MMRSCTSVVIALIVAGCAISPDPGPGQDLDIDTSPLAATNPECADPGVLNAGGDIYVFCTGPGFKLYKGTATAGSTWTPIAHPFLAVEDQPKLPDSANSGTWGPSAMRVGDHYVLWFTANCELGGSRKCAWSATSATPDGPYTLSQAPPQIDRSIDHPNSGWWAEGPMMFLADTHPWLVIKTPTFQGLRSELSAHRLTDDGTALYPSTDWILLAIHDQGWECNNGAWSCPSATQLIEGPSIARMGPRGDFKLMYAANGWRSPDYSTGYADCGAVWPPPANPQDPLAPRCAKRTLDPQGWLLRRDNGTVGIGSGEQFTMNGQTYFAVHAWDGTANQCVNPGDPGFNVDTRWCNGGTLKRRLHIYHLWIGSDGMHSTLVQ